MVYCLSFRAFWGHKNAGCWLQVAGGCSSKVQTNENVMNSFKGGCLPHVVAQTYSTALESIFMQMTIIVMSH